MSLRRPLPAAALLLAVAAAGPVLASGAQATPAAPDAAHRPAQILGHTGVGPLTIGDSAREARAAGATLQGRASDACRGVVLPGREEQQDSTDGYLERGRGVVAIFAREGMRTTEGVRLGSTLREAEAAYPRLTALSDNGYRYVMLPDHRAYQLGFDRSGTVDELLLLDTRQGCFG